LPADADAEGAAVGLGRGAVVPATGLGALVSTGADAVGAAVAGAAVAGGGALSAALALADTVALGVTVGVLAGAGLADTAPAFTG
jgi:hypothetical protein